MQSGVAEEDQSCLDRRLQFLSLQKEEQPQINWGHWWQQAAIGGSGVKQLQQHGSEEEGGIMLEDPG